MTRWIIAIVTAVSLIATTATAGTVIKLGTFAPENST